MNRRLHFLAIAAAALLSFPASASAAGVLVSGTLTDDLGRGTAGKVSVVAWETRSGTTTMPEVGSMTAGPDGAFAVPVLDPAGELNFEGHGMLRRDTQRSGAVTITRKGRFSRNINSMFMYGRYRRWDTCNPNRRGEFIKPERWMGEITEGRKLTRTLYVCRGGQKHVQGTNMIRSDRTATRRPSRSRTGLWFA